MNAGQEIVTRVEDMLQTVQLLVAVSRRVVATDWSYDLFSPFWRLYANNSPGGFIQTAEREYALKPGCLYLIPAWVRFSTQCRRSFTHDYIHFYLTGFPGTLHDRLFNRPIEVPCNPLLALLRGRWRESFAEGLPRDWSAFGWASALAHAALATAMQQLDPADRDACLNWLTQAKEVRPALAAIEKSMAAPPGNAKLAALCSLSANHFIRTFAKAVGMTPGRYSLERRLAVASGLLVGTARPIEGIAAETGFTDRFHFSRAFKTRFAIAPAAYRRMHRHRS